MKKTLAVGALAGLLASTPAFAIVSLHSAFATSMVPTSWGAAAALVALSAVVGYRMWKAKP